uniref:Uncharacterized protein n=1 Tax=Plectus sambesii TaxID=2011161 RepID=A0A914XLV5_9BILA
MTGSCRASSAEVLSNPRSPQRMGITIVYAENERYGWRWTTESGQRQQPTGRGRRIQSLRDGAPPAVSDAAGDAAVALIHHPALKQLFSVTLAIDNLAQNLPDFRRTIIIAHNDQKMPFQGDLIDKSETLVAIGCGDYEHISPLTQDTRTHAKPRLALAAIRTC